MLTKDREGDFTGQQDQFGLCTHRSRAREMRIEPDVHLYILFSEFVRQARGNVSKHTSEFFKCRSRHLRYFLPTATGGQIGSGVPIAVVAAAASPDRKAVHMSGVYQIGDV
jgi:hypothetical protein